MNQSVLARFTRRTLCPLAIGLLLTNTAWSNNIAGPPCYPNEVREGWVTEYSPLAGVSFVVKLTDANGKPTGEEIDLKGEPDGMGGTKAKIFIDKSHKACDAINRTVVPPAVGGGGGGGAGASSVLWIEALFFDPGLMQYYLGSNFDVIYERLGANTVVKLPDLYADTNGDGLIGENDVLYSMVDLTVFMETQPSYGFFDVFSVINGAVAGLPGMQFSTTDFAFDPNTGFTGTAYTGNAQVLSEHGFSAAPEPAVLSLLGIGLGLAALQEHGRRKPRRPQPASKPSHPGQ